MINSPHDLFDPELEQQKIAQEIGLKKQEFRKHEEKHALKLQQKHRYKVYSVVKLSMFTPFIIDSTSPFLTCL